MHAPHLLDQILERGAQAALLKPQGKQASRVAPREVDRGADQAREFVRLSRFASALRPQFVTKRRRQTGDARQVLAQTVVQVGPDPPLLLLSGANQSLLKVIHSRAEVAQNTTDRHFAGECAATPGF